VDDSSTPETVGASAAQLETYWSREYGDALLPSLARLYPASTSEFLSEASESEDYSEYDWAAFSSETDFSYRCAAKWTAGYLARRQLPVFEMVFDFGYDSRSGGETTGHPVTHSAELNFVFMRPGMQAEPRRVAEVVAQYWCGKRLF
jgi:carboxylesterase type B